jgi:hypothetical protein
MTKKNLYVIILLLLILFVSLSFYYILNFNETLREGLCLPSCNKVKIDTKTGKIPSCSPLNVKIIQPDDAAKIYSECIPPFIQSINTEINNNYNYNVVQTLYNTNTFIPMGGKNENQIKLNSFFTDFSNNLTFQDKMDNLLSKMSEIQNNPMFINHPKKNEILNSLQKYENERKDKFLEIYKKLVEKIEPYGENIPIQDECINDENKHGYKDQNFNELIKDVKGNIVCYGPKSTFHTIEDYLREGKEGKLTKTSE